MKTWSKHAIASTTKAVNITTVTWWTNTVPGGDGGSILYICAVNTAGSEHLRGLTGEMETRWAYLAGSAGFTTVPAAVSTTVACEGGAAAQQDVEDDPETPKIAALVVEGGLIGEHLHHFRSHVLCWAALREGKCIERTLKN